MPNEHMVPSIHGARCQMVPVKYTEEPPTEEHAPAEDELIGDEEIIMLRHAFERA